MQITIQIKSNYGNEAIYPVCDTAKLFASLVNQKTLVRRDIDHIKKLGYSINIKPATL